jgi:hypothetical protein
MRQESTGEQQSGGPGGKFRSREWDRKNPAYSLRIRPEDAQRLADRARELKVSRDALARALMEAGLDALDEERLRLEVDHKITESEDAKGRYRRFVRSFVLVSWANERI